MTQIALGMMGMIVVHPKAADHVPRRDFAADDARVEDRRSARAAPTRTR